VQNIDVSIIQIASGVNQLSSGMFSNAVKNIDKITNVSISLELFNILTRVILRREKL